MKTHYPTRREFIQRSVASAILTPSAALISQPSIAQSPPENIRIAPELNVPYWIDGKGDRTEAFTISQHANKWIFLKCFQNWCPGCHKTGFPTLRKMVKTFGTNHEKITFAAIQTTFEGHYTNNKAALRPLQLRYETPIPYGHDAGNPDLLRNDPGYFPNTMRNYATRGTPWLIIIAPNRQIFFSNFHMNVDPVIDYFKKQFS